MWIAHFLPSVVLALSYFTDQLLAAERLQRLEWKIEETTREALVFIPAAAKTKAAPVVFAFHGHGGSMKNAAERFAYHTHWPEAICVYMQGLPTPGKYDVEGKRAGWQNSSGIQGDRDLKFFDAVLTRLKMEAKVDEKRIYATGHSNGGGFTYLLWATRGERFAAMAPSAAGGRNLKNLTAKPVLHVAGEKDTVVPFENQKRTMEALRKLNGCADMGKEAGKWQTLYPSPNGTPVVTMIHPGDHKFPDEAPPAIVQFFKQHSKK